MEFHFKNSNYSKENTVCLCSRKCNHFSTIIMALKTGCNITESPYLNNSVGVLVYEVGGFDPIELNDLFNSINLENI